MDTVTNPSANGEFLRKAKHHLVHPERLEGEKLAQLCREFGTSRVTDYKLYNHFKTCDIEASCREKWRAFRSSSLLRACRH